MMRHLAAATILVLFAVPVFAQEDTIGTDFWLTFPGNYNNDDASTLSLFITSDQNANGTVAITGLSFSQAFTVTAGTVTTVAIPVGAEIETADGTLADYGIQVTSDVPVAVYGLNREQFTTDAYLGLPTDILGTDYFVLSYTPTASPQFAVVAAADSTVVTITPSVAAGARLAGVPYTVNLDAGDVYQLRSANDLSGTIVTADKPVALFGAHQCANVPSGVGYCDYLVEQIPPTETWGQRFATVPLASRTAGDVFRVLASENATTVSVNGSNVATLSAGQFYETSLSASAEIVTDKPVLVAQYSKGGTADSTSADPFMMLITPLEQYLDSYVITTPASGFPSNYLNLVVPNAATSSVTIDGTPVSSASFTAIGSSGYSGAQIAITVGSHQVEASQPFGLFVYGFATDDSYGYPGGGLASPVATVATVELSSAGGTSQVGSEFCITATVEDTSGNPVEGVRVDFSVTGANSETGFAFTDASGTAEFCYTGVNAGEDTVTATVGSLSDTADVLWVAAAAALPAEVPTLSEWGALLLLFGLAYAALMHRM